MGLHGDGCRSLLVTDPFLPSLFLQLAKGGVYADLWAKQIEGQDSAANTRAATPAPVEAGNAVPAAGAEAGNGNGNGSVRSKKGGKGRKK